MARRRKERENQKGPPCVRPSFSPLSPPAHRHTHTRRRGDFHFSPFQKRGRGRGAPCRGGKEEPFVLFSSCQERGGEGGRRKGKEEREEDLVRFARVEGGRGEAAGSLAQIACLVGVFESWGRREGRRHRGREREGREEKEEIGRKKKREQELRKGRRSRFKKKGGKGRRERNGVSLLSLAVWVREEGSEDGGRERLGFGIIVRKEEGKGQRTPRVGPVGRGGDGEGKAKRKGGGGCYVRTRVRCRTRKGGGRLDSNQRAWARMYCATLHRKREREGGGGIEG